MQPLFERLHATAAFTAPAVAQQPLGQERKLPHLQQTVARAGSRVSATTAAASSSAVCENLCTHLAAARQPPGDLLSVHRPGNQRA